MVWLVECRLWTFSCLRSFDWIVGHCVYFLGIWSIHIFLFEEFKAEKCFCLLSISSISHLLCYIFVKINANDRIFVKKLCSSLNPCRSMWCFSQFHCCKLLLTVQESTKNQHHSQDRVMIHCNCGVCFVLFFHQKIFFSIKRMSLLFIDVNRKTIREYQRPVYLFTYLLIHFENSSN